MVWPGGVASWEMLMRRFTSVLSSLVFVVCIGTAPAISAEVDAVTPVEEFSRQIDQLKNTFTELEKKIEDGAKTIDGMVDVERARQEIESLRAIVGQLLDPVSDNGAVSQLGAKALRHAREKLRTLEQDTRFTRDEQQYLITEWRKLVEETERAADDLGSARSEFVQLLRVLQTREDFIDELMQIRRATEAVKVIRQLANDIRAASDALKNLIRAIKPPGV
jgi:DNA repair exonuclease SbcCD ATPase subunit